jgi:hypothetical protein
LQLWEETAAKHVKLAAELAPLSALAGRWRQMELSSWRALLERTKERVVADANKVRIGTFSVAAMLFLQRESQRIVDLSTSTLPTPLHATTMHTHFL